MNLCGTHDVAETLFSGERERKKEKKSEKKSLTFVSRAVCRYLYKTIVKLCRNRKKSFKSGCVQSKSRIEQLFFMFCLFISKDSTMKLLYICHNLTLFAMIQLFRNLLGTLSDNGSNNPDQTEQLIITIAGINTY